MREGGREEGREGGSWKGYSENKCNVYFDYCTLSHLNH